MKLTESIIKNLQESSSDNHENVDDEYIKNDIFHDRELGRYSLEAYKQLSLLLAQKNIDNSLNVYSKVYKKDGYYDELIDVPVYTLEEIDNYILSLINNNCDKKECKKVYNKCYMIQEYLSEYNSLENYLFNMFKNEYNINNMDESQRKNIYAKIINSYYKNELAVRNVDKAKEDFLEKTAFNVWL